MLIDTHTIDLKANQLEVAQQELEAMLRRIKDAYGRAILMATEKVSLAQRAVQVAAGHYADVKANREAIIRQLGSEHSVQLALSDAQLKDAEQMFRDAIDFREKEVRAAEELRARAEGAISEAESSFRSGSQMISSMVDDLDLSRKLLEGYKEMLP